MKVCSLKFQAVLSGTSIARAGVGRLHPTCNGNTSTSGAGSVA